MPLSHKIILYVTLGFLCINLVGSGLWEIFRGIPGTPIFDIQQVDALNQLRAYNGLVAAVGLLAGMAMIRIEQNRTIILTIVIFMMFLVISRIASIVIDGLPGLMPLVYLVVEALIAVILLVFMPRKHVP